MSESKASESFPGGNLGTWALIAWLLKDELGKKDDKPCQPRKEGEDE